MKVIPRLWLVVAVGVVVVVAIFTVFLGGWKTSFSVPADIKIASPSSPPVKLLTWTDQAGFTFQYPEGMTINKHDEDNLNYAHIEFTSVGHPGSLIVWAKDTNALDLASWVKSDKRFVGANVLDTTFAGRPGEKILIASPASMLVVGTIDDNILFTIETTPLEPEYWNKIHDTIAGSFTFVQEGAGGNADSATGEEAVDEEEVVE